MDQGFVDNWGNPNEGGQQQPEQEGEQHLQQQPEQQMQPQFVGDDGFGEHQQHEEQEQPQEVEVHEQQVQQIDENNVMFDGMQVQQEQHQQPEQEQKQEQEQEEQLKSLEGIMAQPPQFQQQQQSQQQQHREIIIPEAVREFHEKHAAEIENKEKELEQKRQQIIAQAQQFLMNFHEERRKAAELRINTLKQQENANFQHQETLKNTNTWAAVVELSDLMRMNEQKKGTGVIPSGVITPSATGGSMSSSKSLSGVTGGPVSTSSPLSSSSNPTEMQIGIRHVKDISRMKQVLLDLKNNPK